MSNKTICWTFFLMMLLSFSAGAQPLSEEDSIIITAMKDELARNMNELKEEDAATPFFVAYSLSRSKSSYTSASLGAELFSYESNGVGWNGRVMLGDYGMNDENFIPGNDLLGIADPEETFYLPLPERADYWGIRRFFWVETNRIYKGAVSGYEAKVKAMNESGAEYPLADFAKMPPIEYRGGKNILPIRLEEMKQKAKSISTYFLNHRDILDSQVYFEKVFQTNYFINSEGTSAIDYASLLKLTVSMEVLVGKKKVRQQFTYLINRLEDLPKNEMVRSDLDSVLSEIRIDPEELASLEDDYEGPVILKGEVALRYLLSNLFTESDLIAGRSSLTYVDSAVFIKQIEKLKKALEDSTKKRICSNTLDITVRPHLKEWGGVGLVGTNDIDAEGVIPPDEIVLVRDGRLQSQLNNRIPVPLARTSNGHYRRSVSSNGFVYRRMTPSVVEFSASRGATEEEMFDLLRDQLEKEELSFGMVVQSLEGMTGAGSPTIYEKWTPANSSLEPLKVGSFRLRQSRSLKKIVAVSKEQKVYNLFYPSGSGSGLNINRGINGIPISVIAPAAILIEEMLAEPSKSESDSYMLGRRSDAVPAIKGPLDQ